MKPLRSKPAAQEAVHRDKEDASLAAGGDARAFERLYRGHVGRIHSLARRMAGAEEADELAQEVFIRAWEKLGSFRGDSAFGSWLYRLAINHILSRRASLGKHRARFVASEETQEWVLDTAQARPMTTGIVMDMESAIDALPSGARQVFVLHDVEGYRHEEIASMLEINAGTSKSQLHRARLLLRDFLNKESE